MPEKRFQYQVQDCPLKLSQGLMEYFRGHPGLLQAGELRGRSAELFRSHDISHVIFGLDTNFVDEALADLWTIGGTDVGIKRYVAYLATSREARQVFKDIGFLRVLLTTLRAAPSMLVVFWRTRQMKKRWPWGSEGPYLDRPLNEIRNEFGIQVL